MAHCGALLNGANAGTMHAGRKALPVPTAQHAAPRCSHRASAFVGQTISQSSSRNSTARLDRAASLQV